MEPELSGDERERLIRGILASASGIYGREVCQACGRFGTFSGWAGAMASHLAGEFVPPWHRHGEREESLKKLHASDRRFCEVCRAKVSRSDAHQLGGCWLCATCAADAENRDEDATYPLQDLSRRRYIEGKTDAELRAWAKVAKVL